MLDVMKVGDVTGWMQAAALAEAASLPVSSHTFIEPSARAGGDAHRPLARTSRHCRTNPGRAVYSGARYGHGKGTRARPCLA
jgi:hypothetical protein